MNTGLSNTIKELFSSTTGKIGLTLFSGMVVISFWAILSNPLDFGTTLWNNPQAWADNPKNVPPTWSKIFTNSPPVDHMVLTLSEPTGTLETTRGIEKEFAFDINYSFDDQPSFTSLTIQDVEFAAKPPTLVLTIARPDGKILKVYRYAVPGAREGEVQPMHRHRDKPFRVFLTGDPSVASYLSQFLYRDFSFRISDKELTGRADEIIFGTPNENLDGNFLPLKGQYTITLVARMQDSGDSIGKVQIAIGGSHFGLMGTDSNGRDLARGLIFGFPIALIIGLTTALTATAIGTSMGIISGYTGGKTDICIQRFCDLLTNIPLLPILLFLAFILGQKLWIVMLVLVIFGWPGLAIVIRSMVLQLRSGQLVEATTALGASRWRIMLRHIFPQIAPFVFAQMIFFTPAAILAEAGLSFLGLGDPSVPTWGQILDQGFRTGAVYVGYWWWVLPPGILIVITALTFVLIAMAMESVVDPRLREIRN